MSSPRRSRGGRRWEGAVAPHDEARLRAGRAGMVMMTRLNGLVTLCLALALGAAPAAAQGANCDAYKVDTSLLNISREAGGVTYKDALFDGDTVCVAQQQSVNGAAWGYIAQKVEANDSRTLVDGWAPMQYLQKTGPGQAAAAPLAAPAAPPPPVA